MRHNKISGNGPYIKVLPSDVIAKIAAGEVVDRPASVVKELLENALDAGATSIEIHLKDGGKELIHIKDNGCGIAKEDLEHIFERHATSKLSSIDDLETLNSMGFRGEALYSIAAVSDVTLRTQEKPQDVPGFSGWQLHVRGGKRMGLEPAAPSGQGTEIKIAELFFNTPARRKFLKNTNSELNAILNIVIPYALIYPQKRFVLTHAGRTLLDLKSVESKRQRLAAALNVNVSDLLETDQEFPQESIRAQLVLGNINIQRPRRDLQYFFINNRPVESKTLSFNLNDIYKLILPPGVYGAFVVELFLDPSNIDVNIHPTKREVRIKDESKIVSIIRRMVEYQLMQHGSPKTLSLNSTDSPISFNQGIPASDLIFAPGQLNSNPGRSPELFSSHQTFESRTPESSDFHLFDGNNDLKTRFARARYIGQFIYKYLLFEDGNSLLCVDQHAAQERIMFEQFSNQINAGKVEIQPLLTPLVLKLTHPEYLAWEEAQEGLTALGIETTQFDDQSIAIQTQPVLLKNVERAVRSFLSGDDVDRCDKNTLARRACKASIVTGDSLSASQVEYQRQQLLACVDPFICPHGRPTIVEIKENFLDRQFLRI